MTDLADFEKHLTREGRAPLTVRGYAADVQLFAEWFEQSNGEAFTPGALTATDVRGYRAHLLKGHAAAATVNRRLNAVAAYARWARGKRWIDFDPTEGVKMIERQALAPKWLDKRAQRDLLRRAEAEVNAAKTELQKRRAWRDWCLLVLLLNTGLRVSELCALTLADTRVSERKGVVRVRMGKGLKQREVPLNETALKAMKRWLELRPAGGAEQVFTDTGGTALQARGVQHRLSELGRLAGLEVTPHILRHTFAKNTLEAGATLDKVSALLGHSNLNTTLIYTTPSAADLEKAVGLLV